MYTTYYKRILIYYYSKVEAIIDISNIDTLEQNQLPEWNRLSMDEGYQQL